MTPAERSREIDPVVEVTAGQSNAERLRARHQRKVLATGGRLIRLPVPSWDGDVVLRCRPLKIKKVAKLQGQGVGAAMRMIVDHCEDVQVRDLDTGQLVPAATQSEDPACPETVAIDGYLADILKLRGNTPVEILASLYDHEDSALLGAAQRLADQSEGKGLDTATPEEIDDLLGEADAAIGS